MMSSNLPLSLNLNSTSSTIMSNTQPADSATRDENAKEMEDMGPPLFRPNCTNCDYCTGLREMDTAETEAKGGDPPMTAVSEFSFLLY